MKIGIIVHSVTNNTLRFAENIKTALSKNDFSIELIHIKTDIPIEGGTAGHMPEYKILNLPDCSQYDIVLFGGPVWAFSANPVIMRCIEESNIENKHIIPFVTMMFAFPFLGGGNAMRMMKRMILQKQGISLKGSILCRMGRAFDKTARIKAEEINKQIININKNK